MNPSNACCGAQAQPAQAPSRSLSIAAILGLMGAFFWAIRGSGGYGGAQGGVLAGLGWGVLWLYFSHMDGQGDRRPYASERMLAAILFGVAVGGLTGYGVYTAWVRGVFYLNYPESSRPIAPWTGYAMLFACGLHWGGIAGAFMAWCAPRTPLGLSGWAARIGAGLLGALVAALVVRLFPQWFLPFYGEGLYQVEEYSTCRRALGSVHNIAPHVGMFLGFLAFELVRRDWRAVGMMLVMSLGFALPFAVGGYWHTRHASSLQLDWWKNWEMSIGLGGGLAFGLAFHLFNQPALPNAARAVSVRERIWGLGVPMWLGASLVFMSAYKGLVGNYNLDWPGSVRVVVSLAFTLPSLAALIWWSRGLDRRLDGPALPGGAVAALVGLIVVAGYAVSLPATPSLQNGTLLTLYTGYLGASLLIHGLMRRCLRQCGFTA